MNKKKLTILVSTGVLVVSLVVGITILVSKDKKDKEAIAYAAQLERQKELEKNAITPILPENKETKTEVIETSNNGSSSGSSSPTEETKTETVNNAGKTETVNNGTSNTQQPTKPSTGGNGNSTTQNPQPKPKPEPKPDPVQPTKPAPVDKYVADTNLSQQFTEKYREINNSAQGSFNGSKFYNGQGVAYNHIYSVLKAYAEGKVSADTVLGRTGAATDASGFEYIYNNNQYDLTHKVWQEPSNSWWTNIQKRTSSVNKVTVKLGSLSQMYEEAKSKGLYNNSSSFVNDGSYTFKEVYILKNESQGTAVIARFSLGIGKTSKPDAGSMQPGYKFPQ